MTGAAELLRAAADLIEQRGEDALPGPWECLDGGDRLIAWRVGPGGFDDDFEYVVDEPVSHSGTAEWIALLDPAVAEPLAAWLRAEADGPANDLFDPSEHAVAFARVVLGTPDDTEAAKEKRRA